VGVGTDWIISAIAVSDAYREWSRAEFGTGARAPRSCITRGFREGCTEDRWKRFLSCLASTKISGGTWTIAGRMTRLYCSLTAAVPDVSEAYDLGITGLPSTRVVATNPC
jgi:hypothetical protein